MATRINLAAIPNSGSLPFRHCQSPGFGVHPAFVKVAIVNIHVFMTAEYSPLAQEPRDRAEKVAAPRRPLSSKLAYGFLVIAIFFGFQVAAFYFLHGTLGVYPFLTDDSPTFEEVLEQTTEPST